MRFYIRYTPVRRGITGMEMLPQYLDEFFEGVHFNGIIKDGLMEYGYLEGIGKQLSNVLQSCSNKFSIKKIEEFAFIGYCYPLYNPTVSDDFTPLSFFEMMANHGIDVPEDILPNVRQAQKESYKDIVMREFNDWNDTVADVSKASMLVFYDDSELTSEQLTRKQNLITRMKNIYSPEICLNGMEITVNLLENILVPYYTTCQQIENLNTVEEILNVDYK
jgi:hypothetical protein